MVENEFQGYTSKVIFEESDIQGMCDDLGEILGRLRQKNVFDFTQRRSVLLLDQKSIDIEYKKNDLLEVKRFVELVGRHIRALTYLVRNPTNEGLTKETQHFDRIMGAINYSATVRLRQTELQSSSGVICSEMYKSFNTPENKILALVLLSIANYCDRYIYLEELAEQKDRIEPTIVDLKKIRTLVTILLSSKPIKELLPVAVEMAAHSEQMFGLMTRRLMEGKIPHHYRSLLRMLFQWKERLYVHYNDVQILKDVLLYHALRLKDKNKLYEAWVFYNILNELSDTMESRFREVSGKDDTPIFESEDRRIIVKYQPGYPTEWIDGIQVINDRPDVVIELSSGFTFVIDAKNSKYSIKKPRPYFRQMRSYLKTINAQFGIFVHSLSDSENIWKVVKNKATGQIIIWTSLSPRERKESRPAIENLLALIESRIVAD